MHVTLRRAKGLPSLREELLHRELTNAIRATRREGFRIVQYSVQADHLHLVIEAESASVLSSGMRSFAVRVAMRVNRRVLHRRGHVWGDRYHRRDVLANHLKHREPNVGLLDPLGTNAAEASSISVSARESHANHAPESAEVLASTITPLGA